MATTKVIPEVLDLNESTSESGLKIPTGTNNNRPTASEGMIRNNTNEASQGSASCEEYYNGTDWKQLNNVALPLPTFDFNAVLYTGTGSSNSITGVGFKPDFVVIKNRDQTDDWAWFDSTRGANFISSNNTAIQSSFTFTFDADGFTVPASSGMTNGSGINYIAYCGIAQAGTTSSDANGSLTSTVQASTGLSIVKWTGLAGTDSTVGHGLEATPELIIAKKISGATQDWYVYTKYANSGTSPANYFLKLNDAAGETLNTGSPPSIWAGTEPTSTVFSVGSTLQESADYIAYCFTPITGSMAMGYYTGNGSSTGPTITTGFQPDFLLVHRLDTGDGWRVLDSVRSTSNPRNDYLDFNLNAAEASSVFSNVDFNSTDFQLKTLGSTYNNSGGRYMYLAIKF